MNRAAICLTALAAGLLAVPASAHHSFAMFDAAKTVTLDGTVKEFEWVNPHSWIRMMVADANGMERQWAIEMGSPAQNTQRGFTATTLKPGDKISVQIHPLKDGSRGGQFMGLTLADGKKLVNPNQVRE
jgi:hypothetical protein